MSSNGVAGLVSTNSAPKPVEPVGVAPVAVDKLPIASEAAPTTGVAGVAPFNSGVAPVAIAKSPIASEAAPSVPAVMAAPQMVNPAVMAAPQMVNPALLFNEMLQSLNKIVGSISTIADKYAKRPDRPLNKNMSRKLMAPQAMMSPKAMMAAQPKKSTMKPQTQKKQKTSLIANTSANTSGNTSGTNEPAAPNNTSGNTSGTNEPTSNNTSLEGGSRRNKKSRSLRKKNRRFTNRRRT